MSADPISTIRVRKRDGSLAPYDGNEVAASIMDSARGLDDAVARATLLQAEVEITLFDGMTTDALDEAEHTVEGLVLHHEHDHSIDRQLAAFY